MRLKLNRTLRAALIAAITTVGLSLTQASGAITSANAAGWAALENGVWKYSESFDGSITTTAQSDIRIKDATGENFITFGSGTRSAYTFAVELDLSKFSTPGSNTTMVWGSDKVGFGVEASTRKVTAAIGSNPKWNTTDTALATTGTATIVVTTGDGGSRIFGYDSTGASLFSSSWGNLKEGNPSTYFHIAQAISPAVTKFAVWQTGNGTASEADMLAAYNAMADFPLAPPTEFTWNATDERATWDITSTVWKTSDKEATQYVSGATSTAIFNEGAFAKDVTVSGNITAGTVNVNDNYKFTVESGQSLTISTLAVANGMTATMAGEGTISLGSLSGALSIDAGATVNMDGTVTLSGTNTLQVSGEGTLAVTTLKVAGGTHTISSNLNVTGGGTGQSGDNQKGIAITGGSGTVNINAGTTTVTGAVYSGGGSTGTLNVGTQSGVAKLVATRLEFGDTNSGGSVSRINIGANGTVVVTSNNNDANVKTAGLAVAEWNQNTEISVAGKLYAQSTRIFAHDGLMTLNIQNGGTVAVKGITADQSQNNVVTLAENGKLVLGDTGITSGNGTWNITLNGGEVGITANTTIARALNVAGDVTFNTAKYTWADSGATLNTGEEGGTMTVSGNITGAGAITKTGAGTLILSGAANVINNTIELTGGELKLGGTYDISGLELQGGSTQYVGGAGIAEGNGFAQTTGTLNVVNVNGGTLALLEGVVFNYKSSPVTMENGVVTLPGTTSYSTLYVNNNDGVSFNAAWNIAQAQVPAVAITSVVMATGTTALTADKEGASFALSIAGTGTVNATAATTVTALTGTGKLIVDGSKTVAVQSISGYTGAYEVKAGATIEFINANMAALGNLTVAGEGTVRLVSTTRSESDNALGTLSATNLELADNSSTTGRYYYSGSSSIAGVGNLKFAGGQLWLNSDMTYEGKVTFGTTTYTETNDFTGAAMRVNASGTFTGVVDVQGTAKLVWGDSNKTLAFNNTVTGSGNIDLIGWNGKTGTFTIGGDASGYEGAMTTNDKITLNVTSSGKLSIGSGSNITGAVTLNGALTVNGAATISGIISGAGSLIKDGEGTLTLSGTNTYTGDTVVNGGTLDIQGSIANSKVKVAQDATLTGKTDSISVGIEAAKTATIKGEAGLSPKDSGVLFQSDDETVTIENTGNQEITYSISEEKARVTADELVYMGAAADTVVGNQVAVNSVQNLDYDNHKLTLTHIDTETLQSVGAYMGDVTLQNVGTDAIVLKDITLLGTTVAVYTEGVDSAEGTVSITDTLTAGGGTLLANLTIVANEQGTTTWTLLGQHMTLGSEFTMDTTKGLVNLDITTLQALDALGLGESLVLVKALDETTPLAYGKEGGYTGTWFGQMFNRTDALQGDFQVFSTEQGFGLTKVSNTPEPTTGTLSLLALAALAARRRRK